MPARSNLGAKDFELIAAVLAESYLSIPQRVDLALDFADRLVATSDSFDPVRFVQSVVTGVTREMVVGYSTALRLRVEALEARRSVR